MQTGFRRTAVTLALAAMTLRAILPTGWMPNPSGLAQSPLVICMMDTGLDASMPQMMDMPAMDMPAMDMPGHDHGQQHGESCPFAAAPHIAASAGPAAQLVLPSHLAHFAEKPLLKTRRAAKAQYQPQSPRAPPSFV